MQVTQEKLKAQQMVLFHLGYYKGLIDGIWSAATIDAKQRFEADPSFLPAYPNNGLPFGDRDKLPKGMRYDVRGIIHHRDLTQERIDEINKAMQARGVQMESTDSPEARPQPTPQYGEQGESGLMGISSGDTDSVAAEPSPTGEQKPNQSQHDAAGISIQSNPAGPTGEANKNRVNQQQRDKHKGNR